MPHLTLRSVAVALSALCLCLNAQAETVEVFPLDLPRHISALGVGPNGDIWFADQQGLMRLHDGSFEMMYEFPVDPGRVPQVTMSPSGVIYLDNFQYQFTPVGGLLQTDVAQPSLGTWDIFCARGIIDADERMFCVWGPWNYMNPYCSSNFGTWELYHGGAPQYRSRSGYVRGVLAVSAREFWLLTYYYQHTTGGPRWYLSRIDLEEGLGQQTWSVVHVATQLNAKDSQGRIWMSGWLDIVALDGDELLTMFAGDPWSHELYEGVCLGADGTVWSFCSRFPATSSVVRFSGEDRADFFIDEYVSRLSLLDYDGRVWLEKWTSRGTLALVSISDGGWPPMRLMLHEVATEGTIAVEAQVINNGPVVGVDVYVALELNGQLVYWPNWQPGPYPVQVNLRPGHNQTATIIAMPRSGIPPGTYTFWGCMTGRGTQKLIGPLDRKFETLTIEVGDAGK